MGVLRIELGERRCDVLAVGELGQGVGRIDGFARVGDFRNYPRGVDAAVLGVTRISQQCCRHPKVRFGKLIGTGGGLEIGDCILGRVEAFAIDGCQIGNRRFRAIARRSCALPERGVGARGIKRLRRDTLFLAGEEAIRGQQLFDFGGDRIGRNDGDILRFLLRRRLGCGRRRRRRSGCCTRDYRASSFHDVGWCKRLNVGGLGERNRGSNDITPVGRCANGRRGGQNNSEGSAHQQVA